MADRFDKLIFDALRKATVDRGGLAPFSTRTEPGLFPSSNLGRQAAEQAASDGLFDTENELWTLTEAGMKTLLESAGPRQILEDCVRALEARQEQLAELQSTLGGMCVNFNGLRSTIDQSLSAMIRGPKSLVVVESNMERTVVDVLARWQADAGEDCPLPALYRQIELVEAGTTIGSFHDCLRQLHADHRLYLHPWTGPLYGMPEPKYALMVGHEVAYYASGRNVASRPEYSTDEALTSSRV